MKRVWGFVLSSIIVICLASSVNSFIELFGSTAEAQTLITKAGGGASSTATPAPTASPAPTISYPISQANGGFGIDMSTAPASLFKSSKSLGTAGLNGGTGSPISFARITLAANESTSGVVFYDLKTSDGTHIIDVGGIVVINCSRESSGAPTTAAISTVTAAVQAGHASTAASLGTLNLAFATSTGTGTCDLNAEITIGVGTAITNTMKFWTIPLGQGTWSAL